MASSAITTNVVKFPEGTMRSYRTRMHIRNGVYWMYRENAARDAGNSEDERRYNRLSIYHYDLAAEEACRPNLSFTAEWKRRKKLPDNLVDLAAVRSARRVSDHKISVSA